MNSSLLRLLSRAVFFFGVILGLALGGVSIWSRMEAIHYFFTGARHEPFQGLRCPMIIAPTEKGTITATFKNPADQEDNVFYRADISGTEPMRQIADQIAVPPQQSRGIEFTVDANDIDLGFFVFVKMNVLPNSLHPSQEAVCGILVINALGLAGRQIAVAALFLSLSGMAIGLVIEQRVGSNKDRNTTRMMQILGLIVLLSILAGAMGWWLPGVALLAIAILLLVIFLRLAVT